MFLLLGHTTLTLQRGRSWRSSYYGTDEFRVLLSNGMRRTKDDFLKEVFLKIDGEQIELPERFEPSKQFLALHRDITLSG